MELGRDIPQSLEACLELGNKEMAKGTLVVFPSKSKNFLLVEVQTKGLGRLSKSMGVSHWLYGRVRETFQSMMWRCLQSLSF